MLYDGPMRKARLPVGLLVAIAGMFALLLAGTAVLASRTLTERDAAVREGVLVRAGHELEVRLRESSADDGTATLEAFLRENASSVAGVEVSGPGGVLASAGTVSPFAIEIPAALGPAWRGRAGAMGMDGPGQGMGRGGGRGEGRGGGPPFRIRLGPSPALGQSRLLASAVLVGGTLGASALVVLAGFAARGLAERERREAAEAEGERLRVVAGAGAGLAHQLRNPLAVVKGTAQMLEGRVPASERERVLRIVSSSARMEAILSRLMDFARPVSAQPAPFDLAPLARDVAARAGGPVDVSAPVPVVALADREHVEGILEELLANARAFDPEGRLEVTVRPSGGRAVVEVADRGPGPGVDPDAAFEPYVTSRPEGTGLGLAIVRALASANGGTASLAARPGGGSVATLTLPAERS